MVSNASLLFMGFTLLVSFGMPIGLAIYLCVKKKASILAVLVGALVFLVSQVLVRIPLLQMSSQMPWYQAMASNFVVLVVFLSFTAGLFEETGRYLAFRFLLRKQLETKNALAYGVGHGGFEAIYLIGLTFINNIVISLMINAGTFDQNVAPSLGSSADMVRAQLVNIPPSTFAVAGIERALTILAHIGMSLLVYYAVRYGKVRFYFFALLAHTVLNFGAVMITQLNNGMWFAEGYVLIGAILAVVLIMRSGRVEAWLAGPAVESLPEPAALPE